MNKHIINKVDEIKGYLLNYQSVIDTNYSLFENLYELLKFEKEVGYSRYRREINEIYWAIFSFYCKSIYEEHILCKDGGVIAKEIVRDTYNIEYVNQELFNRYMQEDSDDIKYREFKYSAFQRGNYSNKVNLSLLTDLKILKNGFLKSDRNDPLDPHFLWQDFIQAASRANLFGGKATLLTKICILYDELEFECSEQPSYSQYIDKYTLSDNDTQLSNGTLSLIKKGRPKQSLRDRLICDEQKKGSGNEVASPTYRW